MTGFIAVSAHIGKMSLNFSLISSNFLSRERCLIKQEVRIFFLKGHSETFKTLWRLQLFSQKNTIYFFIRKDLLSEEEMMAKYAYKEILVRQNDV